MSSTTALWTALGLLLFSSLSLLAWWGWQTLDPSLLLFGSRLC
ncbi:hypothetical protein [Vreelandella lutescens]|nr:hypothetical protein [Halomonas lutescens]